MTDLCQLDFEDEPQDDNDLEVSRTVAVAA